MFKKKYIPLIAIPVVFLLFGSLIFCAISAFPELLETDAEKEARLKQEAEKEAAIYNVEITETMGNNLPQTVYIVDDYEPIENAQDLAFEPIEIQEVLFDDNVEVVYIDNGVSEANIVENVQLVEEANVEVVEETIVEQETVTEELTETFVSSSSGLFKKADFQVTFICEHCSVDVYQENIVSEDVDIVETINSNVDFAVVCEEGYEASLENIVISGVQGEDYHEIENDDIISHISNIKSNLTVTISAKEISEEDVEEDQPILIEQKEIANVPTEEKSHNEIIECTLLVVGIVDVLSLLLIRKKKSRTFHI